MPDFLEKLNRPFRLFALNPEMRKLGLRFAAWHHELHNSCRCSDEVYSELRLPLWDGSSR